MLLDIGQSGKAAVTPINSHSTGACVHCRSVNPTANIWASQQISGVGARYPKTWSAVTLGRCMSQSGSGNAGSHPKLLPVLASEF